MQPLWLSSYIARLSSCLSSLAPTSVTHRLPCAHWSTAACAFSTTHSRRWSDPTLSKRNVFNHKLIHATSCCQIVTADRSSALVFSSRVTTTRNKVVKKYIGNTESGYLLKHQLPCFYCSFLSCFLPSLEPEQNLFEPFWTYHCERSGNSLVHGVRSRASSGHRWQHDSHGHMPAQEPTIFDCGVAELFFALAEFLLHSALHFTL